MKKDKISLLFAAISLISLSVGTAAAQTHFVTCWTGQNPIYPMALYIIEAKTNGVDLATGDEIGVFDGTCCVGATAIGSTAPGFASPLLIKTSQDDGSGCGFQNGNPISLKIWDADRNIEVDPSDSEIKFYDLSSANPVSRVPFSSNGSAAIGINITVTTQIPEINIFPNTYDFGDVKISTVAEQVFLIRNDGNADLNVNSTTIIGTNSDQFTIYSGGGAFALSPSDSRNLTVRFIPSSIGSKEAILQIESNDPDENPLNVALSGNGGQSVPVDVTINTEPSGLTVQIDGSTFTTPKTIAWEVGTTHTLNTEQLQLSGSGTRHSFINWDEGTGRYITVTASNSKASYTAYFVTQYYLETSVSPAGVGQVSPSSGWYASGTNVSLSAQPLAGSVYSFTNWSVDLDGSQNPTNVLMDSPKTIIANFADIPPRQITVTTNPPGLQITVNGAVYTAPQTFSWQTGQRVEIGTTDKQISSPGIRNLFESWSDGGTRVHQIIIPDVDATLTANFVQEYELSTTINPVNGGTLTINPIGPWYAGGTYVTIAATANTTANYAFSSWSGAASGSSNEIILRMNAPKNLTANFVRVNGDALVSMPDLTVPPGETVDVPVYIQSDVTGKGIISYQFTINYSSSVIRAVGTKTGGTLTSAWQPTVFNNETEGMVKIGCYNSSELVGTGVLLYIIFEVIGNPGNQTNLTFADFVFNSGVPKNQTQNGLLKIEQHKPDITGQVYYHRSNPLHPIEFVRMNISGGLAAELTKSDGKYEFIDLAIGGNYTVTPTMNRFAHVPVGAIHSTDAALAAKAVFELVSLTDMQKLAADVDKNLSIQMYDAALILYYAVVGPPLSADSYVGEWLFRDASRSYPNLQNNQINQNYEAIVLGDVNTDLPKPPTGFSKANLLFVDLGNPIVAEPESEFRFNLPDVFDEQFISLFFRMEYDAEHIEFARIEKSPQGREFIIYQKKENNSITCGVLATRPTTINDGLLNFIFRTKGKDVTSDIKFKEFMINTEPAFQLSKQVTIGKPEKSIDSFQLLQNYPNPFNPSTKIIYTIPWEEPKGVSIKIYDITGKLIRNLNNRQESRGEYEIEWNGLDDNLNDVPSGLYICTIRAGSALRNVKMLKTK